MLCSLAFARGAYNAFPPPVGGGTPRVGGFIGKCQGVHPDSLAKVLPWTWPEWRVS